MELLYFSAHLELSESETKLWTKAQAIRADGVNSWVRLCLFCVTLYNLDSKRINHSVIGIYLFIGHDQLFKQEKGA